jgi:hypothetical protein
MSTFTFSPPPSRHDRPPAAAHWLPTRNFAKIHDSKFPCLTIDGNANSRGTSAVFQTVTLFYAVCTIFPSKSFVFYQIKSDFLIRGMVFGRHFVTFAIFSLLRGIYAQKQLFWGE